MALAPEQPDNVERVEPARSTDPITDDPRTIEQLAGFREVEPEPTPDWARPFGELAEGQKTLQDGISKLTDAIAALAERQPVDRERIIERPVEPEPAVEAPAWRGKVKPEQAELLREAILAEVGPALEEFKARELAPTLGYLVQGQETLLEDHLAGKYPDDDFGYNALKDRAKKYREAGGFQMTLEDAFSRVAFYEMNSALARSRAEKLAQATADKQVAAGDAPEHVGEGVRAAAEDGALTPEERHLAKVFFEGKDPRSGQMRTQKDMEAMWIEHRQGAKRDMMGD